MLCALLLTTTGCLSTSKRFERALSYEEAGEYARAARDYLQVLQKEPDRKGARDGLARVGAIAIGNYLDEAGEREQAGAFEDAISLLDELDELRTDAYGVGVNLSVPPDYDQYREDLVASALAALIGSGERAEQNGSWQEAIDQYERALTNYDVTVDQAEALRLAMARVFVKWGEEERQREYFRSAYRLGGEAISVLGLDHPRAISAIELQDRVLAEGTRYVTFFPIQIDERTSESAPAGVLQELNDMMQYEFWSAPPPFVASTDPVQMRRELRRTDIRNRIPLPEAIQIGRILEADYIVLSQAITLNMEESRIRDKTIETRTRGRNSLDTTFTERSFTAELNAEILYRLIDVESQREIDQGTVELDVSRRLAKGIYAGDFRDLDLSYDQRRLFDEEELNEELHALEDELLDELGPKYADTVFEEILKQIN